MMAVRWGIAGVACLPLVLTAVRVAGWWPCDVACQGGGHYQQIAGIDVLWPALVAYAGLALLALHDAWRRPRWSPATGVLAGLLAGVSLFYIYVAWGLGIVCPFCLTVHGAVLVVLLAVAGDAAGPTAVALLLGAFGANAVFHHQLMPDVAPVSHETPALSDVALRADANRSRGQVTAPVVIDYALSLQCGHCAEQHQPLLDALAPAVAAGRVRLVVHPVVRPSDPGSVWLAQCALAAAAHSSDAFDDFLREHLGTRAGLSRDELLALGGDLTTLDHETAAVAGVVEVDQQTLNDLGYRGATPFIAVRRDGRITRFARDIPLPELLAAIGTL